MSEVLGRAISSDLWRRIGFTVAALLVVDVMSQIPLPGINLEALLPTDGARGRVFGSLAADPAWARLSIGALNVWPLLSAFFLFELWRTVSGQAYGGDLAGPSQPRVVRWIVFGALVMAAFQAWGVAQALEQIRPPASGQLVLQPGLAFRLSTVATFVGATAVMAWLMSVITRHGVGSGLWILFASLTVHQLLLNAAQLYELYRTGAIAPLPMLLLLGFFGGATALLAAVDRAQDSQGHALAVDPWLPLMGFSLYVTWLTGMQLLWASDDSAGFAAAYGPFAPGGWIFVIGFPLCVAAVGALRAVRFNAHADDPVSLARLAPAIAAVALICCASALLALFSDGLFLGVHSVVPITVAALAAMKVLTAQRAIAAQ